MQSLEHLQAHLNSLQKLRSIVGTMKALSAASIRQFEASEQSSKAYFDTVAMGLTILLQTTNIIPEQKQHTQAEVSGAIVFSSDHGLCGRFNDGLIEYVDQQMSAHGGSQRIICVGSRGAALLEQSQWPVDHTLLLPATAEAIPTMVKNLLHKINLWRSQHAISDINLFYNQNLESSQHYPVMASLLPIDRQWMTQLRQTPWPSRCIPDYSMATTKLFSALVQQYLFITLLQGCARSIASEHASRLLRMQAAQHNLDQRIEEVHSHFLNARQGKITNELLDVIAGYESLTR